MKRSWISLLLVALLFALLAMAGTSAETNDEIDLSIDDEDIDIISEPVDLDIPEKVDLLLGEPEIEEIRDILLDTSLDGIEAVSVSANSVATNDGGSGDFEIINGILVKYNGPGGDVVIPDGVTGIGQKSFYFCSTLCSITIPNSVNFIDDYAFQGCTGLSTLSIPNSVITIGASTFQGCTGLTSIDIPDNVTSIGYEAFFGCNNLVKVIIPKSITNIEWATFAYCSSLTTVIIPNGITNIGDQAFAYCSSLSSIIIPQSVNLINGSAFKACTYLVDVTIESFQNILISDNAFESCYSLSVFHTICETPATKWVREHGYTVDTTNHISTTDPAVAATCTETGLTEGSHCSVCNTVLIAQEVVPAKGHTPVTDKAVAATCTETGLTEGKHCSVCNAILTAQEVVPAKGHTPVTDAAVAPTLTQTGLTEGSHCSVCGEVLVKQKIVPKLISIKKCSITGISDKVYAAKAFKPAPVVKYNGKKLKKGTDYNVAYKNNKNIGMATVTITGKGKYGASVNKTFKINPKPVTLSSLTAGSKQLTVKWKKGKNITGYEIQYSLKSTFKSAKKVTISKASTVKTILMDLKANKTYYVRIRTYKTVKGKKYYSTWSKAKSAKPTK